MASFRNFNRAGVEDYFSIFTDFIKYTAADWVITTTEAGAGSATEALVASGLGGQLLVTNDDADNDKDFFQYSADGGTTPLECFKFQSGKALQFLARFKAGDVTESDIFLGLYITDTDPVGGITDGVYFRKDDGDASLDCVVIKNSTATTQSAAATLANDTFVEVEIWYDGGDKIDFFVNGTQVAGLATTNMPDDEELALSFGIQNGAAAAKTLTVDYIGAKGER